MRPTFAFSHSFPRRRRPEPCRDGVQRRPHTFRSIGRSSRISQSFHQGKAGCSAKAGKEGRQQLGSAFVGRYNRLRCFAFAWCMHTPTACFWLVSKRCCLLGDSRDNSSPSRSRYALAAIPAAALQPPTQDPKRSRVHDNQVRSLVPVVRRVAIHWLFSLKFSGQWHLPWRVQQWPVAGHAAGSRR